MRYSKDEQAYILGKFSSGDTVTVSIYKLSDDSLVVDSASCSEIASTGIFKYLFTQSISQQESFLWIMTNGTDSVFGEIVLGGYMDGLADSVDSVKAKTDNLQFTADNDVKATLDGETVVLSSTTEQQIDNIETELSSHRKAVEESKFLLKPRT